MQKRIIPILIGMLIVAGGVYFWVRSNQPEIQIPLTSSATPIPTALSAHAPNVLPLATSPLKKSITFAGDYLIRQQLLNGELAYQVNLFTNDRSSTPSNLRLMGGVSALYSVCRVTQDSTYCEAADRALEHYLPNLLTDPERFKGT